MQEAVQCIVFNAKNRLLNLCISIKIYLVLEKCNLVVLPQPLPGTINIRATNINRAVVHYQINHQF